MTKDMILHTMTKKLVCNWRTRVLSAAHSSSLTGAMRTMLLVVMMTAGTSTAWGQTGTDRSGIFYFVNGGSGKDDPVDPKIEDITNPDDYFYLVPADNPQQTNKRDAWYSSDYSAAYGDQEKPYLTTYKTKKDNNSIWIVKFASTETVNNKQIDFYYLIHAATGKYVVYEPPYSAKNNRKSVHLLTTNNPGDIAKFAITTTTPTTTYPTRSGYYNFRPKSVPDTKSTNRFLNTGNANYNFYYSSDATADGVANYFRGLIGLYKNHNIDGNVDASASDWKPEAASIAPTITNVSPGKYKITPPFTLPEAYTIYYTLDNNLTPNPNPANGIEYEPDSEIEITANGTLRAWIVGLGFVLSDVAEQDVFASTPPPTFEVTCGDNKLQINSDAVGAQIYYDDSGNDNPTNTTGTLYETPLTVADGTEVYAIAYLSGSPSSVAHFTYHPNTTAPNISFTAANTAQITCVEGATIYYTTNGTDPVIGGAGVTSSTTNPTSVSVSADVDVELRAIAKLDDRGQSCPVTIAKRPKQPTISAGSECSDDPEPVRSHKLSFTGTQDGKTYWYALSNGSGQSAPALNTFTQYAGKPVDIATIPANPSNPTTPAWNGTAVTVTLHAYAKDAEGNPSVIVSQDYLLKYTAAPTITHTDNTVTIDGEGTVKYRIDGGSEQTYSSPFTVSQNSTHTVTATAQVSGEGLSCTTTYLIRLPKIIYDLSDINETNGMDATYDLGGNINISSHTSIGTSEAPFTGSLNGNGYTISGLDAPIFGYVDGAQIYNVMLDEVGISNGSDHTGAIAGTARGETRIYNIGVLGGSLSAASDKNCGSIVGQLEGNARVINCFSYADITGGDLVGGIVGNNQVASGQNTKRDAAHAMVMNCMFYGNFTGKNSVAPIYNGTIIDNRSDNSVKGVNTFNYFLSTAAYVQNDGITKVYNSATAAEPRFLQRFEFFRHTLNSNRALAAWWATGSVKNADKMYKWVLEPENLHSAHPYPVLKPQGTYHSIVNYDPAKTYDPDTKSMVQRTMVGETKRNRGRKIGEISINGTTYPVVDKDDAMWNYTYGCVQLPYYSGSDNYRNGQVVTGWEITVSGTNKYKKDVYDIGTDGKLPYNFADRSCTGKDNYATSGRIYAQGAYWPVPEGVTSITISPHWAKAVYLSDEYYDWTYTNGLGTPTGVQLMGKRYNNGDSYSINGSSQPVYTSMDNAVSALFSGETTTGKTPYDYAVVLVGNYHLAKLDGGTFNGDTNPFTLMSADLNNDNEPDNTFFYQHSGRKPVAPIRFDFINIPGMGMVQKGSTATNNPNIGIFQPNGWFEITNTVTIRLGQFEFDMSGKSSAPLILMGGYIEQMMSQGNGGAGNNTTYIHLGGNLMMDEFQNGCHQDQTYSTRHVPVSVTGGEFGEFHLTGTYRADATIYDDDAECYINGGKFGKVSGAGNEGLGTSANKGNVTWQINHADMDQFYGGGQNFAKPIKGNITTTISNSRVELFCGGPKFGDMQPNKTVTTTATNCIFGKYFGAGYGGNSYNRYAPKNLFKSVNYNWNDWLTTGANNEGNTDFSGYKHEYNSTYKGVATNFSYEFIPLSGGMSNNVARLMINHVGFSKATTNDVTSTLTGCTIEQNFYGGGSLGKVNGDVTSTLTNCTVDGSVYGAGYSATLPKVMVMKTTGFKVEPEYLPGAGVYKEGVEFPDEEEYHWEHAETVNSTATAISEGTTTLYTTEDLTTLGTVEGKVTLNIGGSQTQIKGNVFEYEENGYDVKIDETTGKPKVKEQGVGGVYGGGESSDVYGIDGTTVTSEVEVNVTGGSISNVFGGGKGKTTIVGGDVTVNIGTKKIEDGNTTYSGSATITGDVYGGSALGNTNAQKGTGWSESDLKLSAIANKSTHVNFYNGTITHDLYGGGKGQQAADPNPAIAANVFGPVTVTIEGGSNLSVRDIYGCNNLYGTPKNTVTVTVNKTNAHTPAEGENPAVFAVRGVYGGGNLADYDPTESGAPAVTINNCASSIKDVFGGGNAAAVPATNVIVNGGIIDRVFAGGNGETAAANVTGNASAVIHGGTIRQVFGGSNTSGTIGGTPSVRVEKASGEGACEMHIEELYGGGNLAASKAGSITIGCTGGVGEGIGDVYGGANAADIGTSENPSNIELNITGGSINRVFGGNNASGTIYGTITVNVNWATGSTACGTNYLGYVYGGGNLATYTGSPTVNIQNGTITHNVFGGGNEAGVGGSWVNMTGGSVQGGIYGGCNTSGTVAGNIVVDVMANVGASGSGNSVNIFGGGYGKDTETNGNVTVNIGTEDGTKTPIIYGDIYGGSALGNVNDAETDITTVNFLNGTLHGNIYGGGLGSAAVPAVINPETNEVTTPAVAGVEAKVNGQVEVNISNTTQTAGNCHIDLRDASIYGCNNTNGSPQDNVTVNIYKTAYNFSDYLAEEGHDKYKATYTEAVGGVAPSYAIDQVFGGGNLADYSPASGKKATVNVIGCANTIRRVFGGGNAAAALGVATNIAGGRFDYIFGGGNGEDAAANIGAGGTDLQVNAGIINHLFGGSNKLGTITGQMLVAIDNTGDCDENIKEFFAGGNEAVIGTPEIPATLSTTIACGTVFDAVYGGSNLADIYGNVTLTINGGTIGEVYAGSKGTAETAANIYGSTTLNIYGGAIGSAFGGSNINGNIDGNITVNLDWSQSTCTDKSIGYIYGASNLATYNPTKATTGSYYPAVNILHGTVTHSVFGGGNGDENDAAKGVVTGKPKVTIGDAIAEHCAIVTENVYGGGNNAAVTGNTSVTYNDNNETSAVGRLFGGGNAAGVSGTSSVTLTLGKVNSGIYGGCNTSGEIGGDITVDITAGTIGSSTSSRANVHGGGLGSATTTQGNVTVNIASSGASAGPTIYGDIYGGSGYGQVSASGKLTQVNFYKGTINGDIYGGGLGDNDHAAEVSGDVAVNISGGVFNKADGTVGGGSIFGCNNANGTPKGNVAVNIYATDHGTTEATNAYPSTAPTDGWNATTLDDNAATQTYAIAAVYGGGNLAAYVPAAVGTNDDPHSTTVHVYGCGNTIQDIYGGGNAANVGSTGTDGVTANTSVIIEGGRIKHVFGGGNGAGTGNPGANIYGTASTTLKAGLIDQVFGGSNERGSINGIDLVIAENSGGCDKFYGEVFGGGNMAGISGSLTTTIECGAGNLGDFYGGANAADIDGSVTLNIKGGTFDNVFGGSKGEADDPADISGDVTLNLYGGTIENAFGGSDVNGNIGGKITVNMLDLGATNCGLTVHNIYGGGRNASYTPNTPGAYPEVNLIHGTVSKKGDGTGGNVFGGGYGSTATVTSSPHINIGYVASMASLVNSMSSLPTGFTLTTANVKVEGDVYGGGEQAPVSGGTAVAVQQGTIEGMTITTAVDGDVYGGGKLAEVSGAVAVALDGGTIGRDVYGGGALANTNTGYSSTNSTYTTSVTLAGAAVTGNVYGGGLGRLADNTTNPETPAVAANVNGPVTVTVSGGSAANVFGCNNLNGSPKQTVSVNITGTSDPVSPATYTITSVYGGGNQAAYNGSPTVQMSGGKVEKVFGGGLGTTATVNGSTSVTMSGGTAGYVFGGGNEAPVTNNATVTLKGNATVNDDVFGGGNKAVVNGTSTVNIQEN